VVAAQAVAGRQLVRWCCALDTHVVGGTTRQRADGLVWQQTTVSGRPHVEAARSCWLRRWQRVRSVPAATISLSTRRMQWT
jgi:hypothetical protein